MAQKYLIIKVILFTATQRFVVSKRKLSTATQKFVVSKRKLSTATEFCGLEEETTVYCDRSLWSRRGNHVLWHRNQPCCWCSVSLCTTGSHNSGLPRIYSKLLTKVPCRLLRCRVTVNFQASSWGGRHWQHIISRIETPTEYTCALWVHKCLSFTRSNSLT